LIQKLVHRLACFPGELSLLPPKFTLLLAQLALLLAEGSHLLPELSLFCAGVRLHLTNLGLKFSELRLQPAYILNRCIRAHALYRRLNFFELCAYVWRLHSDLLHALAEFFLLFAQGFLLFSQRLLFLS